MVSMRCRTLSPSSSFFVRSLGLSGSRWPSAHWPWPAVRRDGRGRSDGAMRSGGTLQYDEQRRDVSGRETDRAGDASQVDMEPGDQAHAVAAAEEGRSVAHATSVTHCLTC